MKKVILIQYGAMTLIVTVVDEHVDQYICTDIIEVKFVDNNLELSFPAFVKASKHDRYIWKKSECMCFLPTDNLAIVYDDLLEKIKEQNNKNQIKSEDDQNN